LVSIICFYGFDATTGITLGAKARILPAGRQGVKINN